MDFKKKYIIRCTLSLLSIQQQPQQLTNSDKLEQLLSSTSCNALLILYRPGKSIYQKYLELKLVFPEENFPCDSNILMVTILKIQHDIDMAHVHEGFNVSLSTADCSRNLSNDISKVYMQSVDEGSDLFNLLKSLKDSDQLEIETEQNELDSLKEEFAYWKRNVNYAMNPEMKKKAEHFVTSYGQIQQKWLNLENVELKDYKDLISITFDSLENIWMGDYPYNARRFSKLIKCFTESLWRRMCMLIPDASSQYKNDLIFVENTMKLWIDSLREYRTYNWQSKTFQYNEQHNYILKIEEVKKVLILLQEISVINSKINLELDVKQLEEIFQDTVPLSMNSVLVRNWEKALKKFYSILQSKSLLLAIFFKQKIVSVSMAKNRPLKVLQNLGKWSSLLDLPEIRKALSTQKTQIFKIMSVHIQEMKKQFESRTGQSYDPIPGKQQMIRVKNFSPFVSAIAWSRQVHDKVKRIHHNCEILFKNEKDFDSFDYEVKEILKDIQNFEVDQLTKWKNELSEAQYSDNGLGLETSKSMMQLDTNNSFLKVNYSEKLITLIRDIRQLSEFGLKKQIPKQIIDIAETGRKYYKEALILKKIANFYNNMNEQIIYSQRTMLLREMQNFEEAIANVNNQFGKAQNINWNNPDRVQSYIKNLNEAANILVRENGRLHKIHFEVMGLIQELSNNDLRKDRQSWLLKLEQIKSYIQAGCKNKEAKYCRRWKVHCDVQLYKILQMQFISGLEDVESIIPEINVDVIMKNKEIVLKPSLEELKDKYYKQILNYLLWPSRVFKGINGNLEIYQKLGERNSIAIKTLLSKAESIFTFLGIHMKTLDQWGVIPYLSINGIHDKIKTMQQWQFNIRVIRMKRKELEKVADSHKIQNFNINHIKLKNIADDYLVEFLQQMMNALKDSVISETNEIEQFLTNSLSKLSRKPSSIQEMQEKKSIYLDIKSRQKQMKRKIDEIIIKKKWILQATGYQHQTDKLQQEWEQFSIKIQDYDNILAEQIQYLKGMISGRIQSLNTQISKYESKTSSILIPDRRSQIGELVQFLKDERQEQKMLVEKIRVLRLDCEQFELPIPNIAIKTLEWQAWDILIEYYESLAKYEEQSFIKMKTQKFYEFQDTCTAWLQKCKKLDKTKQVQHILKQVDLFKSVFTILRTLSSGILQRDHWRQLWGILQAERGGSDNIRLKDMLSLAKNIIQKISRVQDVVSRAQGEATLVQALKQLAIWWQTAQFELTTYEGKRSKCQLIKEWKEMSSKVSDNMCLVLSLKQSRWVGKFLQTIEGYQSKIGKVERGLHSLQGIQRRWVYLEPILVGGALPQQLQRFNKIDLSFRNIMGILGQKPKIATLADIEGLESTLDTIQEQQQKCQKALNEYLQVKRSRFPRFYFLGDEDLLEILAQTQNPLVIQLHIKKLFAAIHSVGFNADNSEIVEIVSIEKERVVLNKRVRLSQNVEIWLNELQANMFSSLELLLKEYIKSGGKEIKLTDYPSQILCVMEQIRFSTQLESAIRDKNLKGLQSQLKQQLQNLTKILPSVGRLESLKLKAIILDLIHHLNIVSLLLKQGNATLSCYGYKKNFRFTSVPELHLFEYKYKYTFEYQGNLPKLVHTPLTDKCYITLSLALSLGMGGNPYGPAGTGKTQTVKAMAMLFGRMCLVFNCDEGLDYKSMARIFLGLVRCGAWGCFDEFNRLLQEQLSAISQQIQVIQFAIKANESHLQLIGKRVEVNPNSGIFVTLNPAGKGYGGRSRLPDNLKQLFRPVAMSIPDNELIAEVLLYSEGFRQAKQLAQKVICLFGLSKQLLSNQQHYDWGLRALKTILAVAGRLIYEYRSKSEKGDKAEDISFQIESQLLIKAIRINTLSKLTFTDMRKFKYLLGDIFPGIESKDILYENIQKNIKIVLQQMKLSYNEAQVSKILQFYQATQQRMGVVLVGPSGCGKTTIWKVLKRCYQKMSIPLKTYLINPKSMPRQQLLGFMNNDTRQFNEGVLTVSARDVVKNSDNNWIILDGDIDPQWIQSLNSVLDDNHLLTLPTGERISFPNGTCFIFETDSLIFASPATVSRMGMIFLNNEDINIQGIIQKWTQSKPHLIEFFKTLDIQSFLGYEENVQSTLIGQVNQILSQMKSVTTLQQFIAACSRGLVANHFNDPSTIINKVFEKFNQRNPFSGKEITSFYAQGRTFRTFSTLPQQFDLYEILSDKCAVLQTSTIQSYLQIIRPWVQNNQHFIIVGPEGCGKRILIKQAFVQIRKIMKINFATIYCNSQTNALHVIQKLYQICLKANSGAGKILKPKECARLVLYLKDINLPKPDKYQTIQLASFLQQIISHKGFYDPTTLQFVQLDEKIQIVVSMFPSSSIGRNQLTQRFTAIVKILNINYPSNEDLTTIYLEYFRSLLKSRKLDESQAKTFSNFFIQMYLNIKKNFSVDEYRHYSFTPKSLFEIFKTLPKYDFSDQEGLIESVCNQFSKNYKNKIVGQQGKNKFDQLLTSTVRNHFRQSPKLDNNFTFLTGKYMKLKKQDYHSMIKAAVIQYQREYKQIVYVSTEQSLNYISSIQKVLSGEGNILLVGCSGTGRRTSLILAALIQKLEVVTLNTTRDFSAREFRKQIKTIIENVVNENRKQVLFLQDHNFGKPEFIEMINGLIVSGQIPGLFTPDQLDRLPVIEDLRKDALGKTINEIFCERVINNLKIVLSLDYQKQGFFEMCASNPSLYTCNIIWFDNLSITSLRNIASQYFGKYLPEFSRAAIDEVSNLVSESHKSLEEKHKVPQRLFYNVIENYIKIYKQKNQAKKTQGQRLQKGLQKLQEAKQLVDVLSRQAFEKQKLLQVKNTEASKAMVEIQKAMTASGERKAEAQELSRALQVEQQKILSKKQSVQEELAEVQPMIEEAKKSVQGISSKNLNELASLPKPPQAVVDVMKVLVKLFGESNSEWNEIKTFLKNRSFIDNILNFDPRVLNAETRRNVEKQLDKNQNSFQKEVIYRASVAAGPLAQWVKATLKFSRVVQTIRPLESQLNKLLKELQSSKKRVIQCEEEIAVMDKKGKQLKKVYEQKIGQAVVLDNHLKKSQQTLSTAKNLLSKLQDQRVRWQQDFNSIEKQVRQYPISSFIAASFTTYLGDKDQNERQILVSQWKSRTKMENFSFLKFMTNQSIQLRWRSLGLASDSLSVQNSAIIFSTSKVPLLMDPNNQAIEWLKRNQQKMQIVSQRNPKFSNTLELAVRFGKQLLIQQLEQIQPILIPIIRKDSFQQGSRVVIKVGDKVIDFNEGFRLYLATRNTNVELPANVVSIVSLINYSVTRSGLESKLLSMVINHERPELEKKKSELLENEQKLKTSLSKLQEELLAELGNSSGNILENKTLLDNLTKTKVESTNISQSLKQSEQLNIKLDRQRDIYRKLSKKGAQIYLIVSQLYRINNMYKFSLAFFTKLFLNCLNQDQNKIQLDSKDDKARLDAAQSFLNKIIFNSISSSLFKIDRLAFGLYLIKGVNPELISQKQWEFFTGIFPAPLQNKVILPTWANFQRQQIFNTFCCAVPKVAKSINFNDSEFQTWFKSQQPERNMPSVCSKLTAFQKILLVMVFRPQKLQKALIEFTTSSLGINSISGTTQSIKSIAQKQINENIPALFVVSTGYDPSKQLEQFCQAEVGRENYLQLSMGGGQNQAALQLMKQAAEKGQWLCLKNIHLVTLWLPILQKQFRAIENRNPNFRLFLTSEQHHNFPNVLLQTCFKVSYESPPGMKKNFTRIYQQLEASGSPLKASFVFLLAYFHSLVQERRAYIPQGWSKSYEFSYSDLKVSMEIISNLIKQYEQTNNLNLETLYGIFQQGIYGGRIDNPSDLKVLRAYLRKYFNLLIINGQAEVALGINIPKNQKQLTHFISKLPEIDNPSLFDLPNNIDKAVQRNNSLGTISNLKKLVAVSQDSGSLKKQEWFKIVTPILQSWQQIYKQIKDSKIAPIKQNQLLAQNPVESFIYLEMSQALELLEKIDRSLKTMENVLQGKGLMTTQIQKLINKLIANELPKQWEDFYSESDQPMDWIRKFGRRIILIKQWVLKANAQRLNGEEFNLSQLFHPGVFLNACKQSASRNKIALDKLQLVATFQQDKASQNCIKIKGLLLQGCSMARHLLGSPSQTDDQFQLLPVLYIDFLANPPPMYPQVQQFCLFSSVTRENVLMKLTLGINGNSAQKIIAGTALMLKEV